MALYSNNIELSFHQAVPGALRSCAYRFAKFAGIDPATGSPTVDISTDLTSQTSIVGAFRSNIHSEGEAAGIVIAGEAKVAAGAVVAEYAAVTSDALGRCITCNSGSFIAGMAMEPAGAANEVIRVLLSTPCVRQTW